MLTNIAWMIYLADVVENVKHTLQIAIESVITYIVILLCIKVFGELHKYLEKKSIEGIEKRSMKIPVIILVLLFLINAVLPSKNTIYIAAGAVATDEVIKKISENKEVNIIKDKVITLVNKKLDEAIVDSKVGGDKK